MKKILFVFLVVALGACGDLSPPPPDSAQPLDSPPRAVPAESQGPAPVRSTIAKKYSWGLPIGDVSPNFNERDVYLSLRAKDCAEAQSNLDDDKKWQGFNSPRNVLLAQAGIEFCKGNNEAGKRMFDRAKAMGWAGLQINDDRHASCEIYKSASSLIEQRPRDDFRCPKGEAPKWKQEEQPDRLDPR